MTRPLPISTLSVGDVAATVRPHLLRSGRLIPPQSFLKITNVSLGSAVLVRYSVTGDEWDNDLDGPHAVPGTLEVELVSSAAQRAGRGA